MTPLPPVRKRSSYQGIGSDDLVFALFHDRVMGRVGDMDPDKAMAPLRLKMLRLQLELLRLKHGKHDQSSHGRKGARGKARAATYQAVRGSGGSVQEARAAADKVSEMYRLQQRRANIDRQMQGEISDKERASLAAERERITGRVARLAANVPESASEHANAAYNYNPAANVRGRRAALYEYDNQATMARNAIQTTRNRLEEARRNLAYHEGQVQQAAGQSTAVRRQYEKSRNEAKRDVARLEKDLKDYERMERDNQRAYDKERQRLNALQQARQPKPQIPARDAMQVTRDLRTTEREMRDMSAAMSRAHTLRSSNDPEQSARGRREYEELKPRMAELKQREREIYQTTVPGRDGMRVPIEAAPLNSAAYEWNARRQMRSLGEHPESRDMLRERIVSEVVPQGVPNRAQVIEAQINQRKARIKDLDNAQYGPISGDEKARMRFDADIERGIAGALISELRRITNP